MDVHFRVGITNLSTHLSRHHKMIAFIKTTTNKQTTTQTTHKTQQNTYSGVAMCQKVCVWGGGGGGAHRHVIFVPSVKNQYKRVVFGCMVI